jgi:hyperosmotically inducible periplasmic protein
VVSSGIVEKSLQTNDYSTLRVGTSFASSVARNGELITPSTLSARIHWEAFMRTRLGVFVGALVLCAQAATAQVERKDLQVFNDISNAVNRYSFFTIFDDVSANVDHGTVTLTGKVTMPYKRDDIEKRVAKVDGVQQVVNRLEVLPVSNFDDELRHRIARTIYGNANFWNYAIMANPPIHIIVDHGHVTLTGVVQSNVDRMLARSLVTQFGVMSVKNDLRTEAEVRQQLEQS